MIVFVSGTRTGLGLGLARRLLDAGHHVVGCSRKPSALCHERYRYHQVDLTDHDAVRSLFRSIRTEFGRLDGMVNNAGTSVMNHFMTTPASTVRDIFDINVFAALNSSREAVKLLMKSDEPAPCIVNISSVAVPWALDGQLAYSASKGAVEQATRVMSRELAGLGIRVNGLGLPPVETALTRTVPKDKIDGLVQRQALKRMCRIEDVVGPVEFLLSAQSAFVTGEMIYLGGVR